MGPGECRFPQPPGWDPFPRVAVGTWLCSAGGARAGCHSGSSRASGALHSTQLQAVCVVLQRVQRPLLPVGPTLEACAFIALLVPRAGSGTVWEWDWCTLSSPTVSSQGSPASGPLPLRAPSCCYLPLALSPQGLQVDPGLSFGPASCPDLLCAVVVVLETPTSPFAGVQSFLGPSAGCGHRSLTMAHRLHCWAGTAHLLLFLGLK